MRKKLISLNLALILILCLLPVGAYAEGGTLSIDRQPTDAATAAGARVSFSVAASTTLPVPSSGANLFYQWQSREATGDWTYLGYDTGPTLSFRTTKEMNGRQYRCIVRDRGGDTLTTDAVTLTVPQDFSILSHPATKHVIEGCAVTFSVETEGNGLTYRWQRMTPDGGLFEDLDDETASTLTFPASLALNGSRYRCVITNSDGVVAVSEPAWLYVEKSVEITEQPHDAEVCAGERVTFAARTGDAAAVASDANLQYLWESKMPGDADWQAFSRSGDVISFRTVTEQDGMQLRCRISSRAIPDNGVVSDTATLTVHATPEILVHPKETYTYEGSIVTFEALASGTNLTYQWQYYTSGAGWVNAGGAGADGPSFSLTAQRSLSGYRYRCVITDGGRVAKTDAAQLNVAAALVKFVEQPQDVTVQYDETATFIATVEIAEVASGSNLIYYHWEKKAPSGEWLRATQDVSSPYTFMYHEVIASAASLHGYQYRCVATRGSQTVVSDAATLYIDGPRILTQPVDFEGAIGDTATFTVGAAGDGLKYQWQFDNGSGWKNSTAAGAKTATLSIGITQARLGYVFRCVVTGASGYSLPSGTARMVKEKPLAITAQPVDYVGQLGDMATFTVAAEGKGLSYQWQFDNGSGWRNSGSDGNRTDTFSIGMTAARLGYAFRCVITDARGGELVSDVVRMEKDTPLSITAQPADYEGAIGDTATFTVGAEGRGLRYQWQFSSNGGAWKNSTSTGNKTAEFSIGMTEARLGYAFRCVITDAAGVELITDTVRMIRETPLTIVAQPADYEGQLGDTASFTVAVEGKGLKYQWQFSNNGGAWKNSSSDGNKTATFSIGMTEARMGYAFRCVITDARGNEVISDTVRMIKETPLAITAQPVDYVGQLGSTASFTVAAEGKGLKYQWQFSNNGGAWKNSGSTGNKTAKFSIDMTSARLGYAFRCIVTDAHGEQLITDEVRMVEAAVFAIIRQPADYVGQLGSTATFTVGATGDGLTYQWQFSNNGGAWKNSGSTGAKTATLTIGMTSARMGYAFRCIVTDANGGQIITDTARMIAG